jgi:arylsulfatase A-like enzyme
MKTPRHLLLLLAGMFVGSLAASERPPNIVFIMVDDMGRDWVSCYGADHQTPNIDRLAKQGVRYETAWSTPSCTPTRVTLLTGQYPCNHGWIRHYDVPRWGGEGLSPTRFTTFARLLRDRGYATAIGGKWQINHLGRQPDILSRHGFDEHCVWTGAEDGNPKTNERYWNGFLQTNGERKAVPHGPDAINDFLIGFLLRNREKPFLIYYPMLLTHGPHSTTPLNREAPPTDKTGLYAGSIAHMDRLVGRLVSALDQAGLGDNTLIVFTGANGSAAAGTLHGEQYPKGKGLEADSGAHVPFIVRASFLTKGDRVSMDLIDFTDLYPSFLELAGIDPPDGLKLDGKSFLPSLRGSDDPFEKRNWIYSQIGDFRMVRDWHHLVDNQGHFHDLEKDPRQQHEVSKLDKQAPHRRQRLQMIIERFPENAKAPFPAFAEKFE